MKKAPEGKFVWTVTVGEKGIAIPPKSAFKDLMETILGDEK